MAYSKTSWVDGTAPPLSASNMNKIEQGIYDNSVVIDAMSDYITSTGSTGYWHYVQYNSGMIEAWYYNSSTTVTTGTSTGDGWYRNSNAYTINLSDLNLSAIWYGEVDACITGLANTITSLSNVSTTALTYYVSHYGSVSGQSAQILAHVIGTT